MKTGGKRRIGLENSEKSMFKKNLWLWFLFPMMKKLEEEEERRGKGRDGYAGSWRMQSFSNSVFGSNFYSLS